MALAFNVGSDGAPPPPPPLAPLASGAKPDAFSAPPDADIDVSPSDDTDVARSVDVVDAPGTDDDAVPSRGSAAVDARVPDMLSGRIVPSNSMLLDAVRPRVAAESSHARRRTRSAFAFAASSSCFLLWSFRIFFALFSTLNKNSFMSLSSATPSGPLPAIAAAQPSGATRDALLALATECRFYLSVSVGAFAGCADV